MYVFCHPHVDALIERVHLQEKNNNVMSLPMLPENDLNQSRYEEFLREFGAGNTQNEMITPNGVWQDIKKCDVTKASDTSAANNSTVDQDLGNMVVEFKCSADGGEWQRGLKALRADTLAKLKKAILELQHEILPPKDAETPVESSIPISSSSSVGSSSMVRLTTPPDYPFDKSIFAELDNSLWIILQPLRSEPMPSKRTSTSATPSMTQAAIINCTEDYKVKFATGTLTKDALSWWNSYTKPIGIEQADKIAQTKLKRLLTNKYCPRSEVKKMEGEFYNLVVKGNDLKIYARRFQELAVLCPNMVPNAEKLMEAFIRGLPRSIEGNVTASKPQTLEEAITITQRLMDQVTKHNAEQRTNDHKRKFDDRRNNNNNNYPNNHDNNNYPNDRNNNNYQNNRNNNNKNHQQQNRRQETFRTYGNRGYNRPHPLCRKCILHHTGPCTIRCQNYNKVGHQTRNCRS
uniref:Reverse transcriptase domain-containing protein n=1 Tax=Tanacetum cinerariifolium TaxID=118510 RepID=A0A6L2L5Q9_TANCI|nr:reverse transcriptase domain-containing protein [Tanacetum cinerariifolium]